MIVCWSPEDPRRVWTFDNYKPVVIPVPTESGTTSKLRFRHIVCVLDHETLNPYN